MPQDKNNRNDEKRPISWRWRFVLWMLNLVAVAFVGIGVYVAVIYFQMPSLDAILYETRAPAIVFLDKDGNEIRSANKIMETPVSVETLPPYVWQSIVA